MTTRATPLLLGLLLLAPLAAPAAASETPQNRDCEGVPPRVALLCAGADAAASGSCTNLSQTEVQCAFAAGWNLAAWSETGLPGGGRLAWSYLVESCVSGAGCTTLAAGAGERTCGWVVGAVEPCAEEDVVDGTGSYVLALGECVVLRATVFATAEAWSPDEAGAVLAAAATDASEEELAAACALDDGRA